MGKIFKNRHVTKGMSMGNPKGSYHFKTVETKNKKREVNTFADGSKEVNVYKRSKDGRHEVLVKQNGKKVESPLSMESPLNKKKKKNSCWPGYVAKGKKKSPSGKKTKSGKIKMVNNCVKKKK